MFFDFLQKTFTESIDFLFGSEYTQGTKGGSTMPDNTVSLKNNAEKCILIDESVEYHACHYSHINTE